jgi:hypothetical protein
MNDGNKEHEKQRELFLKKKPVAHHKPLKVGRNLSLI